MKETYKITSAGSQVIKAPTQTAPKKGTTVVKTGNDLRTGK